MHAYQTTGGQLAEALITAANAAASHIPETAAEGRPPAAGPSLVDQSTGDMVALVRRYPVTSVLLGLGMGVLLARLLGSARPT